MASCAKRLKKNNQTAELLGSEQDSRLPDPTVLLHVVDVGHGLAVLVELSKDHQHESQLFLYDTGFQHPTHGRDFTKIYAGNLKRTLENFCYSSNNNDKHLVKKVDGVVISHPHFDHYAGLNFLAKHLPECLKHTKLVVTANFDPVKLVKNASCELRDITLPETHLQFNTEVSDLFFGSEDLFHFYFHKKFPPQLYHITPCVAGPNVSTPLHPTGSSRIDPKKKSEKCTASDQSCEKLNPNESSIILQLRPSCTPDYPSVLLTGDAPAHRVLEAAGERLSVFQVPHHGSGCHLPRTIVDKLQWVDHLALLLALSHRHQSLVPLIEALHKSHALKKSAEAFKTYVSQIGKTLSEHLMETFINPLFTLDNCFPKGSIQVEWYNQHHGIFPDSVIKAVEEEKKKQKRNLTFFKDSLGWAHFYLKVRADLYVVSAGKPFHHPHPAVLTGIIIACKWRKDKCNLAFTNDANLKDFLLSFPSEVRKVASESTKIWYLSTFNSNSPQCGNRPFFTIDPWCLQSLNGDSEYPNPMVAVNPFVHEACCSGMQSLRLEDIKDEMEIQNNTSTERASRLTVAISRGHRRGRSHGIDPPLQRYLTSIGYENPYIPQDVSSVLTILLGPPIVEQLHSFPSGRGSEQSEILSIIPDLLASKTKGDSEFELTETKSAATSAKVNVSISKSKPIQFKSHTVQAASFEVCHAKSTRMKLQLKVDLSGKKTQSVDISKHLTLKGSCGQTLADYVASLQCETSTWLSARKISVGEILNVLLHEKKAIHVVQSLPLFFSLQLSEWSINHYLTTAVIRDNGTVEEAHIYVKTPIKLHPLLSGKVKLCINTLVVHILPGHESHDQGIQIEGECTINGKHTAKLSCQCGSDFPKTLCIVFSGSLAASDIFPFLDVKTTPNSLRFPFTGGKVQDNVMYSIGLNISQILPNTTTTELGSIFFKVDGKFNCFLPPPLNEIEAADVHTTIHYPFTASPKVGLTASFVFKLEVPSRAQIEKATVLLDCYFSATPAAANEEYTFNVTVLPFYRPQQLNQSIQGPAVFDIISALSTSMGSQIAEELDAMLTIRNKILKHIVMRKLALQISSTAVFQAIELEATASHLDIVPNKLQIQSGTLKLNYSSENGLQLECSGIFTFLEHFTYSVTVIIPTNDTIGEIHFVNYDDNLTLNKIVEAFEWFSPGVHSHPIVSSLLDITLKKVDIYFNQNLEITQAELSLTKKELSIGIMTFTYVEVSVMLKREEEQYTMSFSIGTFIGDTLYAELQYSPESHLLTGRVSVTCFSSITGPDALKSFQLESSDSKSFEHMNSLLCKQFMDVFHSPQNQQEAGPGLTAFIDVCVSIPSKRTGKYALEHLLLEVKDALKIRSYILDTFRFEYSRTTFSEDASQIQLLAIVRKLGGTESMVLKFDLAAVTKQASIFTATVKPGPQGSLLKLSSVLDLADCKCPDLPKVDLPPVFDFELKYGSVSFALSPFQVHEFDVAILIQHWQVFQDPELTVHNLTFRTAWKSGCLPELILTDCLLTFLGLKLALNGRITPKAVSIECKDTSSEAMESSEVVKFESVLKEYSPSTLPSQPVIPKDVGLPPMNVKLKELVLHLQEKRKSLRLNTHVTLNNSWSIDFGSRPLSVNELGAALEWEKNNDATTYRAFIYGSFQLCTLLFEVQMALGNNIDSIIVARISCPENLPHFGEVADYLLCPTVPNSSEESSIDSLVPPSMKKITPLSISMAMNVTKKQFFLSGKVDKWGSGYLLVGHLRDPDEMDYVVSLALEDGFRFSQLSESLKFIDEFVMLRCVNLLVSSIGLKRLSDITEPYDQALKQLGKNLQTPFSTLHALGSSEFTSQPHS